jgi:probable HAF family extracellular repeat protein
MGRAAGALVCSLFVTLGASVAHGQCRYEVTVIEGPRSATLGQASLYGLGLNEQGHVVGRFHYTAGWNRPFLWTKETGLIELPLPPNSYEAMAEDISGTGQIVGLMIHNDYGHRGFVYDDGEYTILPPVIPDSGWSYAMAINEHAQVVGYRSITEEVNPYNGFLWSADDGFTDLGVMEGPFSCATDISDTGIVVGWTGVLGNGQAFLWENGETLLLGPVPEGTTSFANAVNNRGELTGGGEMEPGHPSGLIAQPVLWKNGQWHLLGVLPGCDVGGARDINDLTQVVGHCSQPNNVMRAFLWQHRHMYDLNDLTSLDPGYAIQRPHAISNAGQIVADGYDPQWHVVTFLLTPVDRPLADIDGDCDVAVSDLLFLLGDWGKTNSLADINDDGIVNVWDLLALLGDWGS